MLDLLATATPYSPSGLIQHGPTTVHRAAFPPCISHFVCRLWQLDAIEVPASILSGVGVYGRA
jgi:hypothetical protein